MAVSVIYKPKNFLLSVYLMNLLDTHYEYMFKERAECHCLVAYKTPFDSRPSLNPRKAYPADRGTLAILSATLSLRSIIGRACDSAPMACR